MGEPSSNPNHVSASPWVGVKWEEPKPPTIPKTPPPIFSEQDNILLKDTDRASHHASRPVPESKADWPDSWNEQFFPVQPGGKINRKTKRSKSKRRKTKRTKRKTKRSKRKTKRSKRRTKRRST